MKRLAIALTLIAAVVVLYQVVYPSVTVRYRLTLEALVDGQPRSGSGVLEVNYHKNPKLLPNEAEFSINVRGEALQLEQGKPGILFALLREGSDVRLAPEWIVLRAFGVAGGGLPRPVDDGIKQVRQLSGKVELPLTSLPLLVRFRDLNAPKTVEQVDPLDLEKSFGADVKLVRATLEIVPAGIWPLSIFGFTGEPITTGIERQLPWIAKTKSNIDGTSATMSRELSNELHVGNFKQG